MKLARELERQAEEEKAKRAYLDAKRAQEELEEKRMQARKNEAALEERWKKEAARKAEQQKEARARKAQADAEAVETPKPKPAAGAKKPAAKTPARKAPAAKKGAPPKTKTGAAAAIGGKKLDRAGLAKMTVPLLKAELKVRGRVTHPPAPATSPNPPLAPRVFQARGLKVGGKKNELIDRLLDN